MSAPLCPSRTVNVTSSPAWRSSGCTRSPLRTSGPLVSSRMATVCFPVRLYSFTSSTTSRCEAWSPWLKLSRATFRPASQSWKRSALPQLVGPIVPTIFVFRAGSRLGATSSGVRNSRSVAAWPPRSPTGPGLGAAGLAARGAPGPRAPGRCGPGAGFPGVPGFAARTRVPGAARPRRRRGTGRPAGGPMLRLR